MTQNGLVWYCAPTSTTEAPALFAAAEVVGSVSAQSALPCMTSGSPSNESPPGRKVTLSGL